MITARSRGNPRKRMLTRLLTSVLLLLIVALVWIYMPRNVEKALQPERGNQLGPVVESHKNVPPERSAHPGLNGEPALNPAARAAIDRGFRAFKQGAFELAAKYFLEAQEEAPGTPMILFNLGLAEAGIKGRELRAMAWFYGYLAVAPDAEDAAMVREKLKDLEIGVLETINERVTELKRTAKSTLDTKGRDALLGKVVEILAEAGDIQGARAVRDDMQGVDYGRYAAFVAMAKAYARDGDKQNATNSLHNAKNVLEAMARRASKQAEEAGLGGGNLAFVNPWFEQKPTPWVQIACLAADVEDYDATKEYLMKDYLDRETSNYVRIHLCLELLKHDRLAEAYEELHKLRYLGVEPGYNPDTIAVARIFGKGGAKTEVEFFVQLVEGDFRVRIEVAKGLIFRGELDQAREVLEDVETKAWKFYSDGSSRLEDVKADLAVAFAELGDEKKAQELAFKLHDYSRKSRIWKMANNRLREREAGKLRAGAAWASFIGEELDDDTFKDVASADSAARHAENNHDMLWALERIPLDMAMALQKIRARSSNRRN